MPARHRQLMRFVLQVILSLLVLGAGAGRLSGVAHLAAAALAPYSCVVCRGCPVEHAHEVCDCTACEEVAAGVAASAPSVHDVHHEGQALGGEGPGAEPSVDGWVWARLTRPKTSRVVEPVTPASLLPIAPPEPIDPPPRV